MEYIKKIFEKTGWFSILIIMPTCKMNHRDIKFGSVFLSQILCTYDLYEKFKERMRI